MRQTPPRRSTTCFPPRSRRASASIGTVGAMGIIGAGAVVVADLGSDSSQSVTPSNGDPTSSLPVTSWWQAWPTDRHDGPVDQAFLDNARPDYGDGAGFEAIQ